MTLGAFGDTLSGVPKEPVFPGLKRLVPSIILAAVLLLAGCAYFNTFYNAQSYYKDGLRLKEQKQVTQAKAKFDKSIEKSALVISRWPNSRWVDDATFLIGMNYYEIGHYSKAVSHFEQLVLAFPKSAFAPKAELYRGLALLRNKEYGVATVVLDNVRRKYPRLGDIATFNLARSFYDRENYGRAVDSLAAFVKAYPRSTYIRQAVELLADACFRLERWQEAEQWYERSVRLARDPMERARAKLLTAAALLEQGKYEETAKQVNDVVGRYRDLDDQANLLLGRAFYALGRYKEAVETWSKVRGPSELGAEAFFRIGRYHEEKKEFKMARAHYDTAKARRANSDYGVMAVKRLSLLDALAKGESTKREPAEAEFLLAEIHNLNLAEYDEAMRLYQAVYDSFPKSKWAPKALFAKAWILKNVKADTADARPLLDRIIAEYPETEYADESRRWLGLPVPKRKVVEVEPKPETLAVVPETPKPTPKPAPAESVAHVPAAPKKPVKPPSRPAAETTKVAPERTPVITLGIIHFDTDKWNIKDEDAEALRKGAALLKEHPEIKVLITGYCDPRGPEAYNQTLGMKRADAVRMALADAGVDPKRLSVASRGEKDRISTSPKDYWLDRRVEFEITE